MQNITMDPGNSGGLNHRQRSTDVAGTSDKEQTKPDYSCIRCKTALVAPNEDQYDALKRRLQERMFESRGETVYEIGVGEGKKSFGLALESLTILRRPFICIFLAFDDMF